MLKATLREKEFSYLCFADEVKDLMELSNWPKVCITGKRWTMIWTQAGWFQILC